MTLLILNFTKSKIQKRRILKLTRNLFRYFQRNGILNQKRSRIKGIDDLTIAFVGAQRSKWLNAKFRKKNRPTDVLSFPAEENHMGLGELVLCPQVLNKQAKENGQSLQQETDLMVVHGFLHLLGYDHEKSLKEERRMMKIQKKLVEKFAR